MLEYYIFRAAANALFDADIDVQFVNRYKEGLFNDVQTEHINLTKSVFFHFPRTQFERATGGREKSTLDIQVYVRFHNYAEAYSGIRKGTSTEAKSKTLSKSFEDVHFKDAIKTVLNGFKTPYSGALQIQDEEIFLEDKSIIVYLLNFKLEACDWQKLKEQCI